MSRNGNPLPPPDLRDYHKNRVNFPAEELAKYAGLYVAFSPDGLSILASGQSMEEVEAKLVGAGIDPSQVVGSFVEED
jgi:hypothetical protein